jgi:hypothetical protein
MYMNYNISILNTLNYRLRFAELGGGVHKHFLGFCMGKPSVVTFYLYILAHPDRDTLGLDAPRLPVDVVHTSL